MSAAEGARFAKVVDEFTTVIRELGPLDHGRVRPAMEAAKTFRLRTVLGKMVTLRDQGDVYGDKVNSDRLKEILKDVAVSELTRARMLLAARDKPATCVQMAEAAGIKPKEALANMLI